MIYPILNLCPGEQHIGIGVHQAKKFAQDLKEAAIPCTLPMEEVPIISMFWV